MFDRLEHIYERYEELTRLLSDPAIISNQDKFRDLSKEHNDLAEIVRV